MAITQKLFASLKRRFALQRNCVFCQQINHRTDDSDFCSSCYSQLKRNLLACQRCAIPLENTGQGQLICGTCQKQAPSFDRTLATFHYAYPLDKLITASKYKRRTDLLKSLSKEMLVDLSTVYVDKENRPDVIMPIPLHRNREFQRSYNQSEILAKHLARQFDVAIDTKSLQRIRSTPKQSKLDKKQRQKNLRNAFHFSSQNSYHHIALVDDVMTTGATLESAARTLKQSGIKRVDVWCIARAEI